MNTMLMGDFLQFSSITNTLLYSTNIQATFAFTKQTQKKSPWENYICHDNIIFFNINHYQLTLILIFCLTTLKFKDKHLNIW